MNTTIKIFSIFSMFLMFSCGSQEQNNEGTQNNSDVEVEAVTADEEDLQEETDYLVSAHINSQLQVALGEVATEQSQSEKVQEFGRKLMVENKQIQQNIDALAAGVGVEIDPALTPEYAKVVDSVKTYSGKEFDKAFLELVLEEHNEDINRMTALASKSNNPIVRDLVTDNLNILRSRKKHAEELKDSIE